MLGTHSEELTATQEIPGPRVSQDPRFPGSLGRDES